MRLESDTEKTPVVACAYWHDDGAPPAIENLTILDGNSRKSGKLDDAARADLISKIRAGAHHEVEITAVTFRQKDGNPNRNFLRFKPTQLAKLAGTFVGMPVLRDHNKWSTQARLGTIVASEAHERNGWTEFRQTLRIVKPDAVMSVLDGTLDRFSIGWHATGAVNCSVHKQDVRQRGSCMCWPGDRVTVDGEEKLVEYEYQSAEGIETSSVNVPAVKGTKNEEIRIALSAELGLSHRTHHEEKERSKMKWIKLAALLGLATVEESDEDRVLAIVDGHMKRAATAEAAAQSLSTANGSATAAHAAQLATAKAEAITAQLDLMITVAYHEGKLLMGTDPNDPAKRTPDALEAILRTVGAQSVEGAKSFLGTLPKRVPTGVNPKLGEEPPRTEFAGGGDISPIMKSALESSAKQLGVPYETVLANYRAGKDA